MIRNLITSILLFAPLVASATLADGEEIVRVKVTKIFTEYDNTVLLDNNCSKFTPSAEPIGWADIINAGQQLWKVIEDNKPVVHVETPVAHALPRGLSCWSDLERWQTPRTEGYEVAYENGFGKEVVKFRFRLQYTYGGGRKGLGRYLANVTVLPAELNVSWGYTFNARVEVPQAINLGSEKDPLAGIEVNLHWTVKTVLKESQNSINFFIQGDGKSKATH